LNRPACNYFGPPVIDLRDDIRDDTMETLEFIIFPDGRVQETVTGMIGTSCAEVTAAIEAQLGTVLTQAQTAEFFAKVPQPVGSTVAAQATDW
jgi:Protein of unknown function (DUF2997)